MSNPKFKIGDIVEIIGVPEGTTVVDAVRNYAWTQGMYEYMGTRAKVSRMNRMGKKIYYILSGVPPYSFDERVLKSSYAVTIPDGCSVWSDGKIVTIWDKMSMEHAEATCSPEDHFDLQVGINIAYKRLKKKLKTSYLNCKVVCTRTVYTADGLVLMERGKMYTFTEGRIEHCENGKKFPIPDAIPSRYEAFTDDLKKFLVKVEGENPPAPEQFTDPYTTCTFIALKNHEHLVAGQVYHVRDHAARDGKRFKIEFHNGEIGFLRASGILQVIKE